MVEPTRGGSLLVAWQVKDTGVLIIGGGLVAFQCLVPVLVADAFITLVTLIGAWTKTLRPWEPILHTRVIQAPTPGASLLVAWQVKETRILIVGGGLVASQRLITVLAADGLVTLVTLTGVRTKMVRRGDLGVCLTHLAWAESEMVALPFEMRTSSRGPIVTSLCQKATD
ncbi:hypothetical protein JB92DRAFT_2825659 [Gautieria morchelliformis]|nr:hypothetical protein JB92DRAFT_2825659 [Gautieria morchelliformis]